MKQRRPKWRHLEFSILQTLRFCSLGLILLWLYFASSILTQVQAAPVQGSLPQNPCATFAQLQKSRQDFSVVKVQVLGVQNGVVGVMILGLPKRVQATVNGIDVKQYLSDTTQIQCGRYAAGELRSYDLRSMPNMDAGYFQISADHLTSGRSVTLR